MQGKSSGLGISLGTRSPDSVSPSLSPWINDEFPRWSDLLTTHDVARLTRRPAWVVSGLALIGRLPKRVRFHGRGIGWKRHEIHKWMSRRGRCAMTRDRRWCGRPDRRGDPVSRRPMENPR
jgi:hypothetical protein